MLAAQHTVAAACSRAAAQRTRRAGRQQMSFAPAASRRRALRAEGLCVRSSMHGGYKESYNPLEKAQSPPEGPRFELEKTINKVLVEGVVVVIDNLYKEKPYARFFVLETIARVPYFAYTSILHLYETLGWWRRADYLKVHFAESWNEMHHLLIMESLGGSDRWFDRFLAQHTAVVYYWLTCAIYIGSPRMAYNLMEQVETHAFHTYDDFLQTDGERLKTLPPPEIALKYYNGDAYLFDEFQTARVPGERRPVINNLYDVFMNIRDDEAEHCVTMRVCQQNGALHSPHDVQQGLCTTEDDPCAGLVDCVTEFPTGKRAVPGAAAAATSVAGAVAAAAVDAANKGQQI